MGHSADACQADLIDWYSGFKNKPPVYLVHGERKAQEVLAAKLVSQLDAPVSIATVEQTIEI